MDNLTAPDGYQYGARFTDGSVAHRWTGRTQREHASRYVDELNRDHPLDVARLGGYHLVRRRPGGEWEIVKP